MRKTLITVLAVLAAAGTIQSCSGESRSEGTSDLYLLEELETARAIEDVDRRIERLEMFAGVNSDHPYRALAWEGVMEAMAADKGDVEGAEAFYDKVMETEGDPAVRGQLLFAKFSYFWGTDSLESVAIARQALDDGEQDFRTLMYMAYYLMGAEGQEGIADSLFRHLIDVTRDELKKNHARTVYGEFLEKNGRGEEALEVLGKASSYTFANEPLGRIMWEKGRRDEALDCYIRLSAGAPGYRKYVGLDSLYAIVHPEPNDLDERIAAARMVDGPPLPDREFVDIRGSHHSIAGYRGEKMVILAFSPT